MAAPPPVMMMPFRVEDAPGAPQRPVGQPAAMDTAKQSLPLAGEPSKQEAAFVDPRNMLYCGLAAHLASVAIGVTMLRKRFIDCLQNNGKTTLRNGGESSLELGTLPGSRAGVPSMMAKPPVKVLSAVEKLKVLEGLADSGLLSGLEEDGAFSTLEKLGAFSTIEKSLPLVQKLGLLSFLESTLETPASLLFLASASLIGVGPIYLSLAANDIAPDLEGPLLFVAVAGFGLSTVLGAVLAAWAFAVSKLQEA